MTTKEQENIDIDNEHIDDDDDEHIVINKGKKRAKKKGRTTVVSRRIKYLEKKVKDLTCMCNNLKKQLEIANVSVTN
jgi:hypothetical protein